MGAQQSDRRSQHVVAPCSVFHTTDDASVSITSRWISRIVLLYLPDQTTCFLAACTHVSNLRDLTPILPSTTGPPSVFHGS
jgi:hypothetical protein